MNVIFGDNAQGKSNLLEAISLITTGRSFRTQNYPELICDGKDFFYLEAELLSEGVTHTVKMHYDGKDKKLHLNANVYQNFTPLLGSFPSIFSHPSDLDLITSSPADRRRFLNLHLAQSSTTYVHYLSRFWRACKQRNFLLKAKNFDSIDCFESEMAHSAENLFLARQSFLDQFKEPLKKHSLELSSNQETIEIIFEPTYPTKAEEYAKHLKKMRAREKEIGATLHGPHRDDFKILINGKDAKIYASEGQKKTIATALRLSQWTHLKDSASPLFAIDDYEGMLDFTRQTHLNSFFLSMGQVFLTTPSNPKHLTLNEKDITIFQTKQGRLYLFRNYS